MARHGIGGFLLCCGGWAGLGDAVMSWRPIETAPKDENECLLADWRTSDGFMQVCYWDGTHPNFPWRMKDATGYSAAFFTHWMPLPEAPHEAAAQPAAGGG